MFYMFCGPDFLYADAFYSKATTYVLSALEPPGSVPDLTQTAARRRRCRALQCRAFARLDPELLSFFITKQMKVDLHAGQINGTLPILYVFLARSGKTIRSVSPVALDDKGAVHFANENPGPNATRGVRIIFAGSDGVERTLYYFSTDLSNSGVKASGLPEILRDARARQQPDQERVLSAALRQLHHGARLHPRQQRHHHPGRFRHSACLLQSEEMALLSVRPLCRTDRRIPRHAISNPTPSCSRRAQPIDFGIGYRWRTHESNLLLSVRLPDDGSATVRRRRRRAERRRRNRRVRGSRGRRRRSGRSRAASSGSWR